MKIPMKSQHAIPLQACLPWLVGLAVLGSALGGNAATKDKSLPSFTKVKEVVDRHFKSLPSYRPGDLIARSDVKPVFEQLQVLGWRVADREAILKGVLDDEAFLVRQLRTKAGRKFMEQIKKYPDSYDRLDRLTRLPQGRQTVQALIRGPDGYKMIEYMTTTPGGSELGRMLSQAPKGRQFNEPTGRIYTEAQLLKQLGKSYPEQFSGSAGPTR